MALSRREWLKAASLVGMAGALPGFARAQGLEKSSLTIAVGGQSLIYYLPLSVAHLKGYFRDEGVDVQVVDFAGGSKALQAVVGGSADPRLDVVVGLRELVGR